MKLNARNWVAWGAFATAKRQGEHWLFGAQERAAPLLTKASGLGDPRLIQDDELLMVRRAVHGWLVECGNCKQRFAPTVIDSETLVEGYKLEPGAATPCPRCLGFLGVLRRNPRPQWRLSSLVSLRLLLHVSALTCERVDSKTRYRVGGKSCDARNAPRLHLDAPTLWALRVARDRAQDGELKRGEVFELPEAP